MTTGKIMKKTESNSSKIEHLYLLHIEQYPNSLLVSYNLGYLGKTEELIAMFENAGNRDIYPIIQWDKHGTHTPIRTYFVYLEKGEKVIEKKYPINNKTFVNYSDTVEKGGITYTIGYYNKTPKDHFLLYKNSSDDLDHIFLHKDELITQNFIIHRQVYPRIPTLLYEDENNTDLPLLFVIGDGTREYEFSSINNGT